MVQEYRGLAASASIAIGLTLVHLPDEAVDGDSKAPAGPNDLGPETARLAEALAEAKEQLAGIYEGAVTDVGEDAAAISFAHQEFLSDPLLLEDVDRKLREVLVPAQVAVERAFETFAQQLEALEDEYVRGLGFAWSLATSSVAGAQRGGHPYVGGLPVLFGGCRGVR